MAIWRLRQPRDKPSPRPLILAPRVSRHERISLTRPREVRVRAALVSAQITRCLEVTSRHFSGRLTVFGEQLIQLGIHSARIACIAL